MYVASGELVTDVLVTWILFGLYNNREEKITWKYPTVIKTSVSSIS